MLNQHQFSLLGHMYLYTEDHVVYDVFWDFCLGFCGFCCFFSSEFSGCPNVAKFWSMQSLLLLCPLKIIRLPKMQVKTQWFWLLCEFNVDFSFTLYMYILVKQHFPYLNYCFLLWAWKHVPMTQFLQSTIFCFFFFVPTISRWYCFRYIICRSGPC